MPSGREMPAIFPNRYNVLRLALTCLFMTALPIWSHAQSRNQKDTGSAITAALPDQSAKPEIHELEAGPVRAKVTVLRSAKPFPVGGAAFATVEVSTQGKARLKGTEVHFEPTSAQIRNVIGGPVNIRNEGDIRVATVSKPVKRRKLKVIVELALQNAAPEEKNALKVTLRNPQGDEASARLDWHVIDCASEFYSEIVNVRNSSGAGIKDALKAC